MLKIHNIFFRTFLFIFVVIIVFVTFVVYFWAKDFYLQETKNRLGQNIDTLIVFLAKTDLISQRDTIKELSNKLDLRISIIDEEGNVIVESEELDIVENHLNRDEIIKAHEVDYAYSLRFSDTLHRELIYVAKKFKNHDNFYFIRVSAFADAIFDSFISLVVTVLFYIIFFLALLFFVNYLLSIRIKKEMDMILDFLENITKKRNYIKLRSSFAFEFFKISKLLNKVAKRLRKQDAIKAKHTAELQLSNRQKDELISSLSHEFKNPIAIISGYAQTILQNDNLSHDIKQNFLHKIYTNSIKISQIIDKLKLGLMLQQNKQELLKTRVDLCALVDNCVSDLMIKHKNRVINISKDKVFINADETLMLIVISNIIENALKYSSKEIDILITPEYLSITDYGIGISGEDLEKITKKYYRVSSNDWNNSFGLGLFVVSSILKLHDFKLTIKSALEKGSVFTIFFAHK